MNKNNIHQAERLRINEIFYSIQGESGYAGLPCVFIRLTYCNLRCSWCDTPYAFYEGDWMSIDEIVAQVKWYECRLVEITGGEPLVQDNVLQLMKKLCDAGLQVLIETGGHMDISVVDKRVKRIMDVKCPFSGEHENMHWPNMENLQPGDQVKFVIGNREDYDYACEVLQKYDLAKRCPVLMSPVFDKMELVELANWILEDHLPVRLQVQMHKYIWSPETRGV